MAKFVDVGFVWPYGGKKVLLAGSWDWSKRIQTKKGRGAHTAIMSLSAANPIQYKFIVDDVWCYDITKPTIRAPNGAINNILTKEKLAKKRTTDDGSLKFRRFPSIENSSLQEFYEQIMIENKDGGEWVMTEKVHGANFSFATNGEEILSCKRTSSLTDKDRFYPGWEKILQAHSERLKKLFSLVKEELSEEKDEVKSIVVYGEFCGGFYPHKDVQNIEGIKYVQKGLWYSPKFEFYGFDIYVPRHSFLNYDLTTKLFEKAGFLYNKALQRGTLKELLKFDVETFESVIPSYLGLPKIEGNLAEGVVIKPVINRYLNKGSRIILKKKRSSFGEVSKVKKVKPLKEFVKLPKEAQEHYDNLIRYITENRLNAVMSKVGPPQNRKEIGRLVGMFGSDALTDFKKDYPSFALLDKPLQKRITKPFNSRVANMVMKIFLQSKE